MSMMRSGAVSSGWLLVSILLIGAVRCSEEEPTGPGSPTFSLRRSSQVFDPASTYQIGLGDLDGDGDLDAVFSNMGENDCTVWLNDGDGYFRDSGDRLTQWGHGVGVGDLDGDGDLDLFITCASYCHHSRVYLNDGEARFTDSGQDLGDTDASGNGVVLVDMDTDGDLDVVVVYYERPDRVYLNDGSGTLSESEWGIPELASFGDLDADGDPDIFAKERGVGYRVMLNDGQGGFAEHWQMDDTEASYGSVGIGDVDGDGDRDALVCNGDDTGTYPAKVLLNDGTGSFSDSGQELLATKWGRIGIGDLNGDDAADAFVSSFGLPNEVWLNDGAGHFTDSGLRMSGVGSDNTTCVSLGDLDGDGDLDVVVANFVDGSNEIWFNE
jgi:hypothetical protein